MSIVGPAASYGKRKIYLLKGNNETPGMPNPLFSNDDRQMLYATPSYSDESYGPKYFLDSPADDLAHTSNSTFCHSIESVYLESQSPEEISYDEDELRLKLQELERALLDDSNDNDDLVPSRSMEIDVLHHDSPKESASSDSYVSSISCNKETSPTTANTPKELLFECAFAISKGNMEAALTMINELREAVSIQGDPSQRIAAYMVEALAARVETSGKGLYKALKCKEPPSSDRLSAMQVLFEVCPCFRFGFTAANGAIIEAFKGEQRVHIIDFDINQGSQYITLLQTLANESSKPPYVRLTGVDDPESVQRAVGGLKHIGLRLEKLAEALKLPFEFQAIGAHTAAVTPDMLASLPGEVTIVNFAFQLHHMPDESVSTINLRDRLLRMVKSLKPKLVTVVEQDINTNTAPFLTRFNEAYSYYSAMFDSLDATLPRESQERVNVEKQCLARDIVNIVACEGEERIERYEVAGKWKARMMMAGFIVCPISSNVNESIRKLIKQYSDRYKLKEETGALHFAWEDRVLVVASAWR